MGFISQQTQEGHQHVQIDCHSFFSVKVMNPNGADDMVSISKSLGYFRDVKGLNLVHVVVNHDFSMSCFFLGTRFQTNALPKKHPRRRCTANW